MTDEVTVAQEDRTAGRSFWEEAFVTPFDELDAHIKIMLDEAFARHAAPLRAEIERLRAELSARDGEIADWLRSGEADDIVCTHPAYLRDLADYIERGAYKENTDGTE